MRAATKNSISRGHRLVRPKFASIGSTCDNAGGTRRRSDRRASERASGRAGGRASERLAAAATAASGRHLKRKLRLYFATQKCDNFALQQQQKKRRRRSNSSNASRRRRRRRHCHRRRRVSLHLKRRGNAQTLAKRRRRAASYRRGHRRFLFFFVQNCALFCFCCLHRHAPQMPRRTHRTAAAGAHSKRSSIGREKTEISRARRAQTFPLAHAPHRVVVFWAK